MVSAGVAQRQSSGIVNRRLGVRFPSPALKGILFANGRYAFIYARNSVLYNRFKYNDAVKQGI